MRIINQEGNISIEFCKVTLSIRKLATYVIIAKDDDDPFIIMGSYKDKDSAHKAFDEIHDAYINGERIYHL